MRRATALLSLAALWGATFLTGAVWADEAAGLEQLVAAETPLAEGDRIAFFGDSITMQGGHIAAIEKAIKNSDSTSKLGVKIFKHGLNGGRVPTVLEGKTPWGELGGTMEQLVQKDKPTIVVIQLGINDVWHREHQTSKADFEAGLRKMLAMSKDVGAKVILCTPSVIGEEVKNNKLTDELGEYAEIVRQLAKAEGATLCDVHTAFVEELKRTNTENKHQGNLTYDGVHLNQAGNALLAEQVARALVAVRGGQ